jgi:hypothetical protein
VKAVKAVIAVKTYLYYFNQFPRARGLFDTGKVDPVVD